MRCEDASPPTGSSLRPHRIKVIMLGFKKGNIIAALSCASPKLNSVEVAWTKAVGVLFNKI